MKKHSKLFYFLLLFIINTISIHARQAIDINSKNSSNNQLLLASDYPTVLLDNNVKRSRYFDFNENLKYLTFENIGDTLLLNFFSDKEYKAIIKSVTTDVNGITGISSQIMNTLFGYCYIAVSDRGITISSRLPELDERFFVAKTNGNFYLSQSSISNMRENELEGSQPLIPTMSNFNGNNVSKEEFFNETTKVSALNDDGIDEIVSIDILVVYTPAAESWAAGDWQVSDIHDLINVAIQESNICLTNSNTGITFQVVHTHKTEYTEIDSAEDLNRITLSGDGYMDEVDTLRAQYKADIVVFLPKVEFTGGLAWLLNNENGLPYHAFALSRVQQTSWTYTLVHEVGHNMGCGHHKQQTTQAGPGIFNYSAGWRGTTTQGTKYATIMTYEDGSYFADGIYHDRIPYFSSPELTYEGVVIGDATDGNNALTLKKTKHVTSRYSEVLYDATLKNLTIDKGVLSPEFHPDSTEYIVNLPYYETSVTISAEENHPNASVSGTGTKNINIGENIIEIVVTPGDGISTNTYTITATRDDPERYNATLQTIVLSSGSLVPGFDSEITQYTVNVSNDITTISITGIPTISTANISGNVIDTALLVGSNLFILTVTTADNVNQKIYAIDIIRAASTDATLKEINLSVGKLNPEFSPNTTVYRVEVNKTISHITIEGVVNHEGAMVEGNEENKLLVTGENITTLTVTAEDGISQKTYTINVTVKEENSLKVINDNRIMIYPNPVSDILFIKSDMLIQSISIFDHNGSKMKEADGSVNFINIKDLPNGLYIMKFATGEGVFIYKISKL